MTKYQTKKEKATQVPSGAIKNTSGADQSASDGRKSNFNPFLSALIIAPILSIILFFCSIDNAFRLFKREESIALVFNYALSVMASGFGFWVLLMLEVRYLGRAHKTNNSFVGTFTYLAFVAYAAAFGTLAWRI